MTDDEDRRELDLAATLAGMELCSYAIMGYLIESGAMDVEIFSRALDTISSSIKHPDALAPILRLRDQAQRQADCKLNERAVTKPPPSWLTIIPGGKGD